MAAEPISALATTATCTAVGAVVTPLLCAFGIDAASVGAGLLGCIVAQIFLPSETVEWKKIAATAIGSVIVASLGAPFFAPAVFAAAVKASLTNVSHEHANAVASALLGGFAKPFVMLIKNRADRWFSGSNKAGSQTDA